MSHFTGQHTTEEVLVVTRPHWIVFYGRAVETALLLVLIPIIWMLIGAFLPSLLNPPLQQLWGMVAILYAYAIWAFFFISWAHYWFDVSILTNERIVKIDQRSMFNREISEFRISRVQDVRIEIKGTLATFLKFGDLVIETAGEGPAFVFRCIPEPEKIKDIILHHQGNTHP